MTTKDDKLIFSCFECKKNFKKNFNENLIKRFASTYEFCDRDINKFILLLRKGVYAYEYMDSWERFDEGLLPDKEAFSSSLNMEDITDVDYIMQKEYINNLIIKNLDDYHNLCVQGETLLLAGVFENFRNMCHEHELDPAHFLSSPGLAWQAY